MRQKDADGMANSVDPDQSDLVYPVCLDRLVRKLRIVTVVTDAAVISTNQTMVDSRLSFSK